MDLTLTSSPVAQLALVVVLAPKGLVNYLRHHFLDKTFQGLYQVNAFDLALLIPYFIVLTRRRPSPRPIFIPTTCRELRCSSRSLTSSM
jgi:hypothetical protein